MDTLIIGNDVLEFSQYNRIAVLDLSNNNKLKLLSTFNSSPLKINLKNHNSDSFRIVLGNENSDPYNVCIEVDDPVAATNGTAPCDTWNVTNTPNGSHFFSANCALSLEKFVNEKFKIYPNPAANYISIEQKETKGVILQSVQIFR